MATAREDSDDDEEALTNLDLDGDASGSSEIAGDAQGTPTRAQIAKANNWTVMKADEGGDGVVRCRISHFDDVGSAPKDEDVDDLMKLKGEDDNGGVEDDKSS